MGLIALKEEISMHLISLYIQHPQLEGSRILHNIYNEVWNKQQSHTAQYFSKFNEI